MVRVMNILLAGIGPLGSDLLISVDGRVAFSLYKPIRRRKQCLRQAVYLWSLGIYRNLGI